MKYCYEILLVLLNVLVLLNILVLQMVFHKSSLQKYLQITIENEKLQQELNRNNVAYQQGPVTDPSIH